jgi:hypothetical protein
MWKAVAVSQFPYHGRLVYDRKKAPAELIRMADVAELVYLLRRPNRELVIAMRHCCHAGRH